MNGDVFICNIDIDDISKMYYKFKIEYVKIEDKEFNDDYLKKLKKIISSKKIKEISSFEIEDKFFETKISQFLKKEKDLVFCIRLKDAQGLVLALLKNLSIQKQ